MVFSIHPFIHPKAADQTNQFRALSGFRVYKRHHPSRQNGNPGFNDPNGL
jgi:hypothetical protein